MSLGMLNGNLRGLSDGSQPCCCLVWVTRLCFSLSMGGGGQSWAVLGLLKPPSCVCLIC